MKYDASLPLTAAITAQLNEKRGQELNALPSALQTRHEEISSSMPERNGGIVVPLGHERRDMTATGGTSLNQGGNTIETAKSVYGALRAQSVIARLGASILPGLRGNIDLAAFAGGYSAEWLTEIASANEKDETFTAASMSPKRLTAFFDVSRQLLIQSPQAETLIAGELGRACGEVLDIAAIHGTGSSGQPTGLLNTSGVGNVYAGGAANDGTNANGAAPVYADACNLEHAVGDAKADEDESALGFITSPAGRRKLRQVFENGTGSAPVWRNNRMVDRPAYASTAIAENLTKGSGTGLTALCYGNWKWLAVGIWGDGIDLLVDPATQFSTGIVCIYATLWVDLAYIKPVAFAVCDDVDPS